MSPCIKQELHSYSNDLKYRQSTNFSHQSLNLQAANRILQPTTPLRHRQASDYNLQSSTSNLVRGHYHSLVTGEGRRRPFVAAGRSLLPLPPLCRRLGTVVVAERSPPPRRRRGEPVVAKGRSSPLCLSITVCELVAAR